MLESSVTLIYAGVPGGWEWVIIALVVLLLFGAKRIPELARGLGQGIREFKGAVDDAKQELDDAAETITSDSDNKDEWYYSL